MKNSITQLQLFIIAVLSSLILYFNIHISPNDLLTVNIILISATGIFSAILISSLLTGISVHFQSAQTIAHTVFKLSKNLTEFRKMLYYLITSDEIWGSEFYRDYLMKVRRSYPQINRNSSQYDLNDEDPHASIIKDDRFGDRRTRLFLGMLTIANVSTRDELNLIESFNEDYELRYLQNIHEAFNDIWYYIEHRGAKVNISLDTVNRLFRDDFEKYLLNLTNEHKVNNFDKYVLSELASDFYSVNQVKHIVLVRYLKNGLPSIYKIIFVELIALLLFGLVLPLVNIVINVHLSETITSLSVATVIFIFSLVVYHLSKIIFNNDNYRIQQYTV